MLLHTLVYTAKTSILDMDAVSEFLEKGNYPDGYTKSQKRDLRKRAQDFSFDAGVLYYVGRKGKTHQQPRQVIFDQETKQRIVR